MSQHSPSALSNVDKHHVKTYPCVVRLPFLPPAVSDILSEVECAASSATSGFASSKAASDSDMVLGCPDLLEVSAMDAEEVVDVLRFRVEWVIGAEKVKADVSEAGVRDDSVKRKVKIVLFF